MTVRGPALDPRCRVGHPVWSSSGRQQSCSWMDRQGRPASPPPVYPSRDSRYCPRSRKVELCIEPGQSLGLMIRGGLEYGLGIYVTGVDKDSVADRAGLLVRTNHKVKSCAFDPVTHWQGVDSGSFICGWKSTGPGSLISLYSSDTKFFQYFILFL